LPQRFYQIDVSQCASSSLVGAAFCGVWVWAAENLKHVEQARHKFDKEGETD
jgi:hypothetical protein